MPDPNKKRKAKIGDKLINTSRVRDDDAGKVIRTRTYKDDSGNEYSVSKERKTAAKLASDIRNKISGFRVGTNKAKTNANISKQALLKEQTKKKQEQQSKKEASQKKKLSKLQGKIEIAKKKQELKKTRKGNYES